VCTIFHEAVADVLLVKRAEYWKYALRSINVTIPKVYLKNQD
jgi:hypothetical protein